jgi:hypothetical protein
MSSKLVVNTEPTEINHESEFAAGRIQKLNRKCLT